MSTLQLTAGIVFACSVLWLSYASYEIWSFGHTDHAAPADCVIVLGHAVVNNTPSPVFAERIRHAITLYQAGDVGKIVFTGGLGDGDRWSQATAGREYAMDSGLPEHDLFVETRSTNTYENLLEARRIMREQGLESALIVSDPLHLKRTALMANDLGMQVLTSPTPTSHYRTKKLVQLKFLLSELFFYHYYVLLRASFFMHPAPAQPTPQ